MINLPPRRLLLIAFLCMVVGGVAFPFLMIMHVLESTFFLNFLSFVLMLIGLVVGILGAAGYARSTRNDR
ncbi:MAG: hypothetical protein B6D39_04630 [Anaerolineae bacterium UTCFX2]|jgi:positive regulator of sigma E activity|nr:hypothetical protein [Anaerolineales bacterium]OQY92605.1 MAG: hypothetical protein B6D39_04630 [Anaerolineae bacterium UTCFX2]